MTRITIDELSGDKLRNLLESAEIVDADGRRLGVYKPELDPLTDPRFQPQISEEELRRREAGTGGYTTEEVLERLKNL